MLTPKQREAFARIKARTYASRLTQLHNAIQYDRTSSVRALLSLEPKLRETLAAKLWLRAHPRDRAKAWLKANKVKP
jgi:hypothetical protein